MWKFVHDLFGQELHTVMLTSENNTFGRFMQKTSLESLKQYNKVAMI